VLRCGFTCRFTMRGVDEEGHVANFVESEQALLHGDGRQTAFVQIRGSIPLFWSSPVCMKYTPAVTIGDFNKSVAAARKHVDGVVETYGNLGVIFVNLINMKKDEQKLGIKFKEVVDKLERKQQLRYVWFDFHHECRKMKYQNLHKLVSAWHALPRMCAHASALRLAQATFGRIGLLLYDESCVSVGVQVKEVDEDFQKHDYFARAADGSITKHELHGQPGPHQRGAEPVCASQPADPA
jgi:hypothetical protein